MNDEAGFLAAIDRTPDEDTTRLVYADWLDEQPDPSCQPKAAFIRLETRLGSESVDDYLALTARLHQLAAGLDPDWLAVVSRPPIERCRSRLLHHCPGVWSRLISSDLTARTCGSCSHTVHYARTTDEMQACARSGEPVVVSLGVPRQRGDIWPWTAPVCSPDQSTLIERKRLSPRRRANRCRRRLKREDWEELE